MIGRFLPFVLLACTTASSPHAGEISGTVTRSDNSQPITDGYVRIHDSSGDYLGLASIDNSGHYSYSGLAAGNYFALTVDTGFFDELWNNRPCAQESCTITSGDHIAVGSGTVTVNFALATGGSIAGTVTASGQPVTDGYIRIHSSSGAYLGLASIDNSGHYAYGGLATGNYFALTIDTGYFDEIWDNIPCSQGDCTITSGTPIAVNGTGPTMANFALSTGGSIVGAVTAQATGQPIDDGYVRIHNSSGTYLGLASIDNAGHYTYSGLDAGNYFALTVNTGFFDELWDNLPCPDEDCTVTSGTQIHVTSAPVTANFVLPSGGTIAGTVTQAANGQPITDGYVRIHSSSGSYLGLAAIDNGGHYTYSGLDAGNYYALTIDTGFSDELWNNRPCAQKACTVTSGDPISVGAGTTTTDFALTTGGSITGAVTASGQPVTDGYVGVYNSNGAYLGLAPIDNAGHYTYGGLAAGTYFATTTDTGHLDELWDDIPCAQDACSITSGTPIVVTTTGAVTTNFDLSGYKDQIFRSGFEPPERTQQSSRLPDIAGSLLQPESCIERIRNGARQATCSPAESD